MFRYCKILLDKLQQYNMVCLLFTMFVLFSIIMNIEGEEGNRGKCISRKIKCLGKKKSFIINYFFDRETH